LLDVSRAVEDDRVDAGELLKKRQRNPIDQRNPQSRKQIPNPQRIPRTRLRIPLNLIILLIEILLFTYQLQKRKGLLPPILHNAVLRRCVGEVGQEEEDPEDRGEYRKRKHAVQNAYRRAVIYEIEKNSDNRGYERSQRDHQLVVCPSPARNLGHPLLFRVNRLHVVRIRLLGERIGGHFFDIERDQGRVEAGGDAGQDAGRHHHLMHSQIKPT